MSYDALLYKFLKYVKEKLGYKQLPTINNEFYVYKESDHKLEYEFNIKIPDINDSIEDIYIYGWIIENRFYMKSPIIRNGIKEHYTSWNRHWNYKIYINKESAIDAINQIKKLHGDGEFRIIPLYNFRNNGYRTYIINKIIKENKNDLDK
jgi:hypothetical protein